MNVGSRNRKKFEIAVNGMGEPIRAGRIKPRCESRNQGAQCAYVAGHEGYHCEQCGRWTWEDAEATT